MVHNLPSFIDKISKKASFAATNVQTEGRQTWTILTWDASALLTTSRGEDTVSMTSFCSALVKLPVQLLWSKALALAW